MTNKQFNGWNNDQKVTERDSKEKRELKASGWFVACYETIYGTEYAIMKKSIF